MTYLKNIIFTEMQVFNLDTMKRNKNMSLLKRFKGDYDKKTVMLEVDLLKKNKDLKIDQIKKGDIKKK